MRTGERIRRLSGHGGFVRGVAFSPDGVLLASASDKKVVRLWHIDSGEEAAVLQGHSGGVDDVTFSPDGTRLASCGDGEVILWDVEQRTPVWKISKGAPVAVDFSPDGTRIAVAGHDRTARILDVANGSELLAFDEHGGYVYDVAFSPDSRFIATACRDGLVRVWQVQTDAANVAPYPAEGTVEEKKAWVVAELKRLNPGFDGKSHFEIENGEIVAASFEQTAIKNIEPLKCLRNLQRLTLSYSRNVEDLGPLAELPLIELDCTSTRVSDLSPLAGMPLERLSIRGLGGQRLSDLGVLEDLPLKHLNM